jgi:AcrR family transcriptional regulator
LQFKLIRVPDATPVRPDSGPNRAVPESSGRRAVWSRPDRGARGPRPEHSRAEIAAAAISLADSGGLSAVSMRAVAGALGTVAGSLYRYLSSRDELLDLMVDAALGELQLDRESTEDWLDDLVALADDQLALYRRHPWLLEAGLRGTSLGPNATDYFECCLRLLAPVERDIAAKMEATAMITGVVSLFARPPAVGAVSNPFAAVDPQAHPHLSAALSQPASTTPPPNLFERTIRSVLRGLLVDQT